MTAKRAYKLQEFVAHSSSVNCLKIGRRTSRVLVTGGEDHKVNLWSIGKPNAILSLTGHASAIESVSFDSSEVLVAAGAASGTIKLWDLEEAKIVRTLTGHRSNCISVDFHPFGEFFASGSLDTNLKIWDIRRKGCIHTYKGHSRGVNAIRFTPDGRWVVSGGQDNTMKLWDLTAGKLLHDFKGHEGQIQCIDFHPHEFLLATGSADRTVKFWDLETFELIGSSGTETTGVRSMTFNPDGRTLLCGLHESLKVFSWEPIRCHDAVDVGWSRLSDLNIHEGKLLGCSYNQSCVGVWVVDISRIEPYVIPSPARSNGHPGLKSTKIGPVLQTDNNTKASIGRLSVSQNPVTAVNSTASGVSLQTDNNIKASVGRLSISENADTVAKSTAISVILQTDNNIKARMGRLPVSQNSEAIAKENKLTMSTGSNPGTPQRIGFSSDLKMTAADAATSPGPTSLKRSSSKTHGTTNLQIFNRFDDAPVVVPRSSSKVDLAASGRAVPYTVQPKLADLRKLSNNRDDLERITVNIQSGSMGNKNTESNEVSDQNNYSALNGANQLMAGGERKLTNIKCIGEGKLGTSLFMEPNPSYQHENYDIRVDKQRDTCSTDVQRGGRTRTLVASWERRERSPRCEGPTPSNSSEMISATNISYPLKGRLSSEGMETVSASDEDYIADIMEQHENFQTTAKSRLTKLQVVQRLWERKDIRGVIDAMKKMSDHAVSADVISVLIEKSDSVTLDVCTRLLPLLTSLLESRMDRYLGISLEMLLKLVKIFGPAIHSAISAVPSVGVDLEAEQRLERYNLCFIELEKVKHSLPSLTRRGGSIGKSVQELNLSLQEVL